MKLTRFAAFLALPAVVSLAACGGGSNAGFANATGSTANVRIINGAPNAGALDVYFQSTGSNPPSNPILSGVSYAVASDYLTQAAVAGNVVAMHAGSPAPSTGATVLLSCPVPQFANNAKYSIVIVNTGGFLNCELFQDFDYTAAPQYRVHNASPNGAAGALATTAGFGTITAPAAPATSPFTVQTVGPQGVKSLGSGSPTQFTQAMPNQVPAFTGSLTFAVGAGTTGSTPALATLDSRYVFAPNGTTQPNTSGALNVTGTAGTSIFALDCTTAPAPNVACTNGLALVGYTDRL
jgi:Domain of unknown function (DUF4397)